MSLLAATTITRAGIDDAGAAAAGGGDEFVNTGIEFVRLNNGDASPITLTVVTTKTIDGKAVADHTAVIPAGGSRVLGPWPKDTYNDANSRVQLTYSGVTSLNVAVLRPGG